MKPHWFHLPEVSVLSYHDGLGVGQYQPHKLLMLEPEAIRELSINPKYDPDDKIRPPPPIIHPKYLILNTPNLSESNIELMKLMP